MARPDLDPTLGRTEPEGDPTLADGPPGDQLAGTVIYRSAPGPAGKHGELPAPELAVATLAPTGRTGAASGSRLPSFGDYQLVREVGKGGMGVVYEARQVSLDRPVALKMMLAGAFASDEELRRFRNEAEAVAQLEHPNIVPILDVGRFGEHRYFTMRLVRGGSLAERLGMYVGDPKRAAQLVATIAEALHHAHLRGILHRDLKPANILLGAEAEPHITDFGLARRVGAEGDGQLTQTGTILGTPGYMAPEQATGRRGGITVAADVYGLGAVLYALLTGRPPFAGESPLDTLKQVCERAPEAPSRLETRVPRDLETICLKCLEKDPARRYPSALALAEDLHRWVAGEPITARPVGRATRLAMWCRRKPAQATLAGLLILASAAGLGGVLWQWRRAEANLVTARNRFDLAMQAVDAYTAGASEDVLLREPRLDTLRRRLLEGSLDFYRKLGASLAGGKDRPSRVALARALAKVGDLTAKIGSKPQALAAHQEALAIREALATDGTVDPEAPIERAHSQLDVGLSQYEIGRHGEAVSSFRRSLSLLEPLARLHPNRADVQLDLARTHNAIASELFRDHKVDPALESFARSRAIRERLVRAQPANSRYRDELAKAHGNIGVLLREVGRHGQALEAFSRALEQFEALERYDTDPAHAASIRADEVGALLNIAGARRRKDPSADVDATYARALEIAETIARENPTDTRSLGTLAQACLAVGEFQNHGGRILDARVTFARAAGVLDRLARENPSVAAFRSDLVRSRFLLGQTLTRIGLPDEAQATFEAARTTLARLIRENPSVSAYHADLATLDHVLVENVQKQGHRDEILAAYAREADTLRGLMREHPRDTRYRMSLAENRRAAGLLFRRLRRAAEAIAAFREAAESAAVVARERPADTRAQYLTGWSYNARGEDLREAGRLAEAHEDYRKAEAALGPLAHDHPNDPVFVFEWSAVLANLGLVRRVLLAPSAGAADLARAVVVLEPIARAHPERRSYQTDLALMYKELAVAERQAGRPREAATALRRAVAVLEGLAGSRPDEIYARAADLALLAAVEPADTAATRRAMSLLNQAIASGGCDLARVRTDPDLDALRSRGDFRTLELDLAFPRNPFQPSR